MKRILGLLLVFILTFANIGVTFAKDTSQNLDNEFAKGNLSDVKLKPVTFKTINSTEIAGNDVRIKPIEAVNYIESSVDEKSLSSDKELKIISQKEIKIDKDFSNLNKSTINMVLK